ncbi:unnamed protein product [Rotaria sp. Silwood1]|nr:unnamed protein product [Rotaria sp. Silwood1]CAF3396366.1 unnamed protein product [Rotaria sp. Silwood1]CAF4590862.1 unnamed protein product [Rotaria sp. Silwood1]
MYPLETQIPPIVERSSQNWIWLIGLSITAGIVLLIILVSVLWCCGFFKRYRPQYPMSTLVDPTTSEGHYCLASSPKSGPYSLNDDNEETLSDIDDNQMMIQNPVDSLPIVVPQHSSHFIQQQQLKRSQFSN